MRRVLATERGERLYRNRSQSVEPLFGNTKHNNGIYGQTGGDVQTRAGASADKAGMTVSDEPRAHGPDAHGALVRESKQ
jgi:hypothetical protein